MIKKTIRLFVVILLVSFALGFLDFKGLGGATKTVSIPSGSGAAQIAAILKSEKVIRFPLLFRLYVREDAENLRAGVHTFTKSMGYKKALEELCRDVPAENTVTVTIPEGYEMREIAALLEEHGVVSATEFTDACKKAHTRFAFLPKDGNVEGYLFPSTYNFLSVQNANSVVDTFLSTFEEKMYTSENLAHCEALSLSFHEAVTMASIIEREAAKSEERPLVASVFYNRLRVDMPLQSCATVQYILEERKPVLSNQDTKIESPYNTYIHYGLPPAPIASPGAASLAAALQPAETEYLYFVADGSGGHTFSKTFSEHLAAQ